MLWIQRQRDVLEWAGFSYSTRLQLKAAVSFSGTACLLPAAAGKSWEKIYLVLRVAGGTGGTLVPLHAPSYLFCLSV